MPITVDIRNTGTLADGETWVGTPLANGDITVSRNIDYLMTAGGAVNVKATGGDVVAEAGSTIAANGGSVQYQGGIVATTMLLASNGRIYNIADADPMLTYVGIAGVFTVDHSKWGVTTTYNDPLLTAGHFEAGYTDGMAGGSISIVANGGVLSGLLTASTIPGSHQLLSGVLPHFGSLTVTNNGPLTGNFDTAGTGAIEIVSSATALPSGPAAATDSLATTDLMLSAPMLSAGGFGNISLTANALITVDAGATLARCARPR